SSAGRAGWGAGWGSGVSWAAHLGDLGVVVVFGACVVGRVPARGTNEAPVPSWIPGPGLILAPRGTTALGCPHRGQRRVSGPAPVAARCAGVRWGDRRGRTRRAGGAAAGEWGGRGADGARACSAWAWVTPP